MRHALLCALPLFVSACASGPDVAAPDSARPSAQAADRSREARSERPAPSPPATLPDRRVEVRYEVALRALPAGKQLRLWIPLPANDAHQRVEALAVDAPWPHRETREPRFGNRMLYFEANSGEGGEARVSVRYTVSRWWHRSDLAALEGDGVEREDLSRYLQPSRLVVADARIRGIAERLVRGRASTLAKARAFYEHVRGEMRYDKSGQGWGRGDSAYACDAKAGNCTDFHAYFMALCLAADIPTRFQIGLYGPYEAKPGQELRTGGYHCWALFRVPGKAWVPVDISEAQKHPEFADTFFGAHSPNRIALSEGRDLVLAPPQASDPLNYFVDPYCEVDGKPFAQLVRSSFWKDLPLARR